MIGLYFFYVFCICQHINTSSSPKPKSGSLWLVNMSSMLSIFAFLSVQCWTIIMMMMDCQAISVKRGGTPQSKSTSLTSWPRMIWGDNVTIILNHILTNWLRMKWGFLSLPDLLNDLMFHIIVWSCNDHVTFDQLLTFINSCFSLSKLCIKYH